MTVSVSAPLHWHTEPTLLMGLLVVMLLYGFGVAILRQRLAPGTALPTRRAVCFALGLVSLYVTVASPLDAIAEHYLFSAHMLQHVILIYPVSMLLLLGLPGWLLRPLLTFPVLAPCWRWVTKPLVAFLAFNVAFSAWHLPGLYEWALRDRTVHNVEHMILLVTSMLMWWPLLSPMREYPCLPPGLQTLYVLALSLGQIPVFAYLTFSSQVLYPTYETAQRLLPLTPLADQQLGGMIMKVASMAVLFGLLAVAFWRWYHTDS